MEANGESPTADTYRAWVCIAAGAVALGGAGIAKAKADHDASLPPKQPHELSAEELRNAPKCPPVVESYDGSPSVIGKDVECVRGQRVRMAEGFISHGIGTVTEVHEASDVDKAGTCTVIWDSDQCHTRPLHTRLGNCHSASVGKGGHYHLVLAEGLLCSDLKVKSHRVVEGGLGRVHLEVVRACALSAPAAKGGDEPTNLGEAVEGEDMKQLSAPT